MLFFLDINFVCILWNFKSFIWEIMNYVVFMGFFKLVIKVLKDWFFFDKLWEGMLDIVLFYLNFFICKNKCGLKELFLKCVLLLLRFYRKTEVSLDVIDYWVKFILDGIIE